MRAPLVVAVTCVAAGIAAGLQRPIPVGGGPLLVALACVLAIGSAVLAWGPGPSSRGASAETRHATRLVLGGLLAAGILLGVSTRTGVHRSCAMWIPDDGVVTVVGTVVRAVERPGAASVALRLRIDSVEVGGTAVACGSEVPARWRTGPPAGADPDLTGSTVRGKGRWWSPPGTRPGLHRPGALMLDTLEVIPEGVSDRGGPRLGWAAPIRERVAARIEAVFPRHAALVASLLLAQRDGLDRDVRDRYARAGLSHLLAISGLHVGSSPASCCCMAGALRPGRGGAWRWRPPGPWRTWRCWARPTPPRGRPSRSCWCWPRGRLQRPARTEAIIAAAALVLLATDPGALTRPGFQLSFAGVAGILASAPPDPGASRTGWRRWRPFGA
jgi:hypothetical protein